MSDTASTFVFDATIENFKEAVIDASQQQPVLVDFWADWCAPCKQLMPLLEKLAAEYKGAFRVAKVNADQQQQLVAHLGVRSLPTVKLIKQGQLVDEFSGALPESQLRTFLARHVEKPSETLHEQGKRLWQEGDLEAALAILTQANQDDPKNTGVLIDIAQIKAEQGDLDAANGILDALAPEDKLQSHARQLIARLKLLGQAGQLPPEATLHERLAANANDLEAVYLLALHAALKGQNEAAMQRLIQLLQTDAGWREGAARATLIELFDLLGNQDPLVKVYRRKLYALLH